MIVRNVEIEPREVFPGATRKVLAHSGGLMTVEMRFRAGTQVPEHAHPHEQVSYVVSGKIELSLNGHKEIIGCGDSFYAAPGVLHGVLFLEESMVLDTFTPQREDFL